ncbi:hypothetical protein [Pyrobaculum aerophilum]|uniref:hypothetical protein n=1 Tax=Pyrobaculum aerophilum TaxID=13773 RepID=UPI002FD94709
MNIKLIAVMEILGIVVSTLCDSMYIYIGEVIPISRKRLSPPPARRQAIYISSRGV